MTPDRPRRIILIDTRFQLRLAGAFILLQVVLTSAFAFGLYVFMDSELQAGLASAHAAYRTLDQMLFPLVLVLAGFSLALSTALVTGFVVILSHRIAGPLFRFRALLEQVADRTLPSHIRLRPDDQLAEISSSFAHAVNTLSSDVSALQAAVQDLHAAAARHDDPLLRDAVARLDQVLSAWRRD